MFIGYLMVINYWLFIKDMDIYIDFNVLKKKNPPHSKIMKIKCFSFNKKKCYIMCKNFLGREVCQV